MIPKDKYGHGTMNGNTGCLLPFASILGTAILLAFAIYLFVAGCDNRKKKVDETVAVDGGMDSLFRYDKSDSIFKITEGHDYIDRIPGTNIIRICPPVVIIIDSDTSRYYSGDTARINIEYDGNVIRLSDLKIKLRTDFVQLLGPYGGKVKKKWNNESYYIGGGRQYGGVINFSPDTIKQIFVDSSL